MRFPHGRGNVCKTPAFPKNPSHNELEVCTPKCIFTFVDEFHLGLMGWLVDWLVAKNVMAGFLLLKPFSYYF